MKGRNLTAINLNHYRIQFKDVLPLELVQVPLIISFFNSTLWVTYPAGQLCVVDLVMAAANESKLLVSQSTMRVSLSVSASNNLLCEIVSRSGREYCISSSSNLSNLSNTVQILSPALSGMHEQGDWGRDWGRVSNNTDFSLL